MKKREEKGTRGRGKTLRKASRDAFRYARKNESLSRAKQVYRRAARKGRVTMIFLRQQRENDDSHERNVLPE